MKELVNFLRTLSHKIDSIVNETSFEIVFVMGNSSCDMDSLLSSILLSYIRNIESKSITYTNQDEITYNNYSKVNTLHIPVVNCKKGELFWRLDTATLMKHIEIEEGDFFYFEEIWNPEGKCLFENYLKRSNNKEKPLSYRVIMVDHHELDSHQQFISPLVTEVIDHHDDTDFDYKAHFPNITTHNTQFPRASALGLVLEEFLAKEAFNEIRKKMLNNNNFIDMAIGALIVDSAAFLDKTYKSRWVDADLQVAKQVLSHCWNSAFFEDDEFLEKRMDDKFYYDYLYDILSHCKFDEEKNLALGYEAIFNKDAKNFIIPSKEGKEVSYMYSSLPVNIYKITKRFSEETIFDYFRKVCKEEGFDFLIFGCKVEDFNTCGLFFSPNGRFYKEGTLDTQFAVDLVDNLIKEAKFDDMKEYRKENELYLFKSKKQINRKKIVPLVENYFK
mmetsp:Transcript_27873/g.29036  ORF Transcript_27873/g.29036 Transcript_27873/m.29036 type:complete len:445 (+) Transcript_27873:20-1354(+)